MSRMLRGIGLGFLRVVKVTIVIVSIIFISLGPQG
jgi:hypothetical protein